MHDPQSIVVVNQFRHIAAADAGNLMLAQAKVSIALSAVIRLLLMDLDGQSALFGLAFRAPDDTLNTSTQLIPECEPIAMGELVGSAKKVGFIHERWQPKNLRSFRHRSHGVVRQRPRLADCPDGSQLPCLAKSHRSSSR